MRSRDDLRIYQRWGVDKIKALFDPGGVPGLILAFDMGSGKTATTLTALQDLFDDLAIRRALIVAPLLVAQSVWPRELEEWSHLSMSHTLIRVEDDDEEVQAAVEAAMRQRPLGMSNTDSAKLSLETRSRTKAAKLARLANEPTDLHIINKEAVPWLWDHHGGRWPYDAVVIDEASMLKNGKHRTAGKVCEKTGRKTLGDLSRFGALCASRKHTKKVVLLTGTPTPKGLQNLWGLSYYVDQGERLGAKQSAFLSRWFDVNQYSRRISPKDHAEVEITNRLKDIMFSLDRSDLPTVESIPNLIKVKLTTKTLEEYKLFKKTMVSEPYDVEAVNGGVLHGKLLQFANGSLYREDGDDVPVHDCKLKALEDLVENLDGEPLLVGYTFKFDLERIRRKFKGVEVIGEGNTNAIIERWNKGEIPLLLAHPASAGHGLNLQYGGHHLVWYGLLTDLELYLQFNKRLARPGQKDLVILHHIIAEGTIDEEILPEFIAPRSQSQERILDIMRVNFQSRGR